MRRQKEIHKTANTVKCSSNFWRSRKSDIRHTIWCYDL